MSLICLLTDIVRGNSVLNGLANSDLILRSDVEYVRRARSQIHQLYLFVCRTKRNA